MVFVPKMFVKNIYETSLILKDRSKALGERVISLDALTDRLLKLEARFKETSGMKS